MPLGFSLLFRIFLNVFSVVLAQQQDFEKPVIIEGNNHLNTLPDIHTTIRAMKKVDFVVVSSLYAEMPAARYADILLPQIATAFEGRDTGWAIGSHLDTESSDQENANSLYEKLGKSQTSLGAEMF